MKKQVFNPFLPSYEYIPDSEPYVFGERVYIYGSHDCFNGEAYCFNDYVCWSAPVDDLSDWHYEGVIYKKTQDPMNKDAKHCMYAPDVVQGLDGRYYLYYTLDRVGIMAVAVCDTPAGAYEFYGVVRRNNGEIIGKSLDDLYQFDPGIFIDDDKRIYLYSGFAPELDFKVHTNKGRPNSAFGSFIMELEPDMLTVKRGPEPLIPTPGHSKGTGFEGHEFFEASSMRKINGKYYFVYSSINSHELCYAVSNRPDGGFVFGGTIVSIGDVYFNGRKTEDALNYLGNTHGGMIEVKGQWYIFYHRQTNLHQYSRQACAEPIYIETDGSIKQVEVTSNGLNVAPLVGKGVYEARIACNLVSSEGCTFYAFHHRQEKGVHPYFTQEGKDREDNGNQYIANFNNGCMAGFKYFQFDNAKILSITIRGDAKGKVTVSTSIGGDSVATLDINPSQDWTTISAPFSVSNGKHALYFSFSGKGSFDFMAFELDDNYSQKGD
ncbi:MAG: family 43 glycosylhydrolase [Defluviitaleaceae bacterium]|nr:family 43 glycosylhydrolase [Defluviitaleaceae bacterium]